jgi:molybdopterin converting factor small subunit
MAVVNLSSPLRELAGGEKLLKVAGDTLAEVIAGLERSHPKVGGWVVDETGRIREHVKVFVNGEPARLESPVGHDDLVQVLPSISGGAVETATRTAPQRLAGDDEQAELLVGTRKGLFVLRGSRGGSMEQAGRVFAGTTVEFAMRDDRSNTYFASVTGQYGPKLFFATDPLGQWEQADGPAFDQGGDEAVERIWVIRKGVEDGVLWAGVAPAALFRSEDAGRSWTLNRALWDEPSRPKWQPGAGGLCLHSVCPWPGDPSRLAVGISAAGVWLSDDAGASWRRGVRGLVARYLPKDTRDGATDLCIHNMHRAPLEPTTIYMQFHGGVYRSDDAGESWIDIGSGGGLPSDFGFPMVIDPNDPDRAFVIPLVGAEDRVTPEGKVRVFETKDRGETWWPLTEGLPQDGAYLTILRQAFCHDGLTPLGMYFGAESGEVFGTADGGETWSTVADHLAPVLSVRSSS